MQIIRFVKFFRSVVKNCAEIAEKVIIWKKAVDNAFAVW